MAESIGPSEIEEMEQQEELILPPKKLKT